MSERTTAIAVAAAVVALAGCGTAATTSATHTAAPKAPATSAPAVPKTTAPATPSAQGGAIMPPAGSTAVLHVGQTAGMPADAQSAGASEAWTLNSVHYISYAQSQEGRADSTDVAQQIGANEPLPSDQFVVLGVTVKNDGTAADDSPVISGGQFWWVTPAGKTGQTNAYSVGVPPPDSSAGVLAPYVSNAQPTSINTLNAGRSITGYVVIEVPDTLSVIAVLQNGDTPAIVVDPAHLEQVSTCADTAKWC